MRRRYAVSLPLLAALGALLLPGPGARAGGTGDGALRLTVTVNTRGGSGARPPEVRVGDAVVKRYRLVNSGEAHLYGVRVSEPGVTVRCPAGPLAALSSTECTARFPARAGHHGGTATAVGEVPSLRIRLAATARSGYTGVGGALELTETVRVGPGRTAAVQYVVANRGDRPVHAIRLTDTALGLTADGIDCAGRAGTVPGLAPGASARCTATVRRPPGTHRSSGLASGSDRVTTVSASGSPVAPPLLTARASATFTLRAPIVADAGAGAGVGATAGAGATAGTGAMAGTGAGAGATAGAGASTGAAAGASTGAAAAGAGSGVPGAAAGGPGTTGGAGAAGAGAAGAGAVAGAAAGAAGVAGAAGAAGAGGVLAAPGAPGAYVMPLGPPVGAGPDAAALAVPPPVAPPPVPARPVPPARVPPALVPPALVPPGRVPSVPVPPDTTTAVDDGAEGVLPRLRRRARELSENGIALTLLLILIPAAVAAALLGSRIR